MSLNEKAIKLALEIEEDTNYSSTEHFIAAARWSHYHYGLGIPATILAILSGSSALSAFDSHYIVAGVLAIIAGVLSGVATFLNPYEKSNSHLNAGNSYRRLRNETRLFRQITLPTASDDEIAKRIAELADKRDSLNESSLQPPNWTHKLAKRIIEVEKETEYKVDKTLKERRV